MTKIKQLERRSQRSRAPERRITGIRRRHTNVLIVCEGRRTEPNYLRALIADIYPIAWPRSRVPIVEVHGEGRSTRSLIRRAEELQRQADILFDKIWVVFDKDDFNDFDEAIELAKTKAIDCAWTNEAFELWFLLHFELSLKPSGRNEYTRKLTHILQAKLSNYRYRYRKNATNMYKLLRQHGNPAVALERAKLLREQYPGDTPPSRQNPATTVDLLIEFLQSLARSY